MVLHGKVESGVIVLEQDEMLPEGTLVTVIPAASPDSAPTKATDQFTPGERNRVLAIIDRIAALPLEGSDGPFSGANHDDVLYGKP